MAVRRMYKYEVGDEVVANEKCRYGYPSRPGMKGIIYRQMDDSALYDYEVQFEPGVLHRFKEEELDYPAPYKEEVISC
ncbi:MAG: YorP family protein [Bacillaceae bacterium]